MTQVQFLQKEIISHVEGIKSESRLSWPYMFPAAEPFSVRQGRLHLPFVEEVGGLYSTPPPTKRTSLSYLLMPELFPPGSSLEKRREERRKNQAQKCQDNVTVLRCSDLPLMGSLWWQWHFRKSDVGLSMSYVVTGQTLRMACFWTIGGNYRP